MQASQIPTKFPIPFGNNAAAGTIRSIPQASQSSTNPGAASLFDGFPTITGQPLASGGIPPAMQDFNGLFKQITAWNQWQNAGGTVPYDATFSSAVGGYPSGAILASTTPGNLWLNTADNNTTNPDSGSASGWIPIATGAISPPVTSSTVEFTLPSAQTIPNAQTTLLNVTGSAPPWGTFSSNTLVLTKSGNYTLDLGASITVTPSTDTSHSSIIFIFLNNNLLVQQTAVNRTGVTQTIVIQVSRTKFLPIGSAITWYAFGGNNGTSDTVVVNAATAAVTKIV